MGLAGTSGFLWRLCVCLATAAVLVFSSVPLVAEGRLSEDERRSREAVVEAENRPAPPGPAEPFRPFFRMTIEFDRRLVNVSVRLTCSLRLFDVRCCRAKVHV